jgi:hypothetical protein
MGSVVLIQPQFFSFVLTREPELHSTSCRARCGPLIVMEETWRGYLGLFPENLKHHANSEEPLVNYNRKGINFLFASTHTHHIVSRHFPQLLDDLERPISTPFTEPSVNKSIHIDMIRNTLTDDGHPTQICECKIT